MEKKILNTTHAANYIDRSADNLRRARCDGGFSGGTIPAPVFFKVGKRVFYLRKELDSWINEMAGLTNAS